MIDDDDDGGDDDDDDDGDDDDDDDGDDDDDDDDCEQRLWIVTHGQIEVTLQCLWTFRGVAEKLDVDTATKTWLYYSLYLLTAPTL